MSHKLNVHRLHKAININDLQYQVDNIEQNSIPLIGRIHIIL